MRSAVFGLDPFWVATALLVVTYLAIIHDRLNRALVVGVGAGLVIISGVLTQEEAIAGVDFNTLMLLTGMMLIVSVTRRSGIFQAVAIKAAQAAGASPAGILALLSLVTAVFSAFLDNVTTVLLVVPVTIAICRELKVPAYPFLFAEVFAANIGGTATLIGDPPNILIGSAAGLTFNAFLLELGPVVALILAVQLALGHLLWGRRMTASAEDRAHVMAMDAAAAITDRRLMRQSLAVLAAVVAALVSARALRLEAGLIAMFGAAVLIILDNHAHPPEAQTHRVTTSLGEVEWITIFFFIGLFVLVAGVEKVGLLRYLAGTLLDVTGRDLTFTVLGVLWVSALLSAIVDNIPFVAAMIPLIEALAPAFGGPEGLLPLWWALSLGACLGGNGTLVGASANLTVAGLAERQGVPFRFREFTLRAFPLMLVGIAIAHLYLYLRFLR